ncbi:MAG: 3-oxoacyl-[acyl-carrier-protein] reductase [Armatimonadota bacterium]
MELPLQDQVAIITGAGGGIGRATAELLAQAGADIVVNDFGNQEGCRQTAQAVEQAGRRALIHEADVADLAAVEGMVAAALEQLGRLDILVSNAGITRDSLLVRMDEEQWDQVLAVNLRGAFCCTKAVTRHLMRQRSGKIVYISSVIGLIGNVGQANYAASKAGLLGLMRSTARELAGRGVNVNAICPGFIQTPMTEDLPDQAREQLLSTIPLKRLGTPQDVAKAVLFLCSEPASYVTGQAINVDGGMVM